jgi:hypothetical protein
MSDDPKSPLFTIPLLGPLLRQLAGGPHALIAWLALVAVLGLGSVLLFGYPALILLALSGAFAMLGMLIVITRAR